MFTLAEELREVFFWHRSLLKVMMDCAAQTALEVLQSQKSEGVAGILAVAPLLSKTFKTPKQVARRILDREMVEELIYNTRNPRDRLIIELQAHCGLRIGELLKIKVSDVSEWKLILRGPKSGTESD